MIKTIYPIKDTTLYENSASINTGLDEILEISKAISASGLAGVKKSRALVQFDTSTLSSSFAARGITTASADGSLKYYLKMFISEEKDVPANYNISVHEVTKTWIMGTGKKSHYPVTTNGANWVYSDVEGGTGWDAVGGDHGTVDPEVASQSFDNVQGDIEVDVTKLVEQWHSGKKTNYGMLLKRSGSEETNAVEYGTLNYYSKETHTIYPPRLEARYDKTPTYNTTGMTTITKDHNVVIGALIAPEYIQNSEVRIEIIPEPKFPTRSQTGAVSTTTKYALPVLSQYCVIDNATGETAIPYDSTGTKIACTGSVGQYIDLDTSGLFPERYYKLQIKIPDLLYNNSVQYIDIDPLFKIVR
jgi:hypothetical protein